MSGSSEEMLDLFSPLSLKFSVPHLSISVELIAWSDVLSFVRLDLLLSLVSSLLASATSLFSPFCVVAEAVA